MISIPLLLWVVCIYFTTKLMVDKGYSGLLGFALGFFLPIIGLVIALFAPGDPAAE